MQTKTRFVYVIGTEGGPFKIGVATSLRDRLSGIQIGNPIKMIVHYSVEVADTDAFAVEARAHKTLASCRLSGEWFEATLQAARQAVLEAAEMVDSKNKIAKIYAERDRRDAEEKARLEAVHAQNIEAQRRETERRLAARQAAAEHAAWIKTFQERMQAGKHRKKMERAEARILKCGFRMGDGFIMIGGPY